MQGICTNIRVPGLLQSEEAMTRDMNALSITLLGTDDSIALPSTDGQDGTLDKLNYPYPWMSNHDDSDDSEGSQLSVIDEDLTVRYSRLQAEARTLMQAHIVLTIHTLTQYNLPMHSALRLAAWFDKLYYSWTNGSNTLISNLYIGTHIPDWLSRTWRQ